MLLTIAVTTAAAQAAPLVVTHGGVVRGDYSSDDPAVAAVTIRTAEPVTIDGCTLTGRGPLVAGAIAHVDLTVRNTTGTGLNPNVAGQCSGRFIDLESFDRVVVEHCELDQTAGIYLRDFQGSSAAASTVRINADRAKNIDGRKSDGRGGYLPFNLRTDLQRNETTAGFRERQFVQLDRVHAPRMEISWNYVTNEPGRSRVEDNINLYNSGGTPGSPLLLHDNCIRGAYTLDPSAGTSQDRKFKNDWSYSGGGVMLGDGSDRVVGAASGYIRATDNVVISTSNYGMAVSAGHDIVFERNQLVSCGRLTGGLPIFSQNVGAYIWNADREISRPGATFFNDGGRNNLIGWMKGNSRNDAWMPDAAVWAGNTAMPGDVTIEDERQAEQAWLARAVRAGIQVGVIQTHD